jgi:hypothetical protein
MVTPPFKKGAIHSASDASSSSYVRQKHMYGRMTKRKKFFLCEKYVIVIVVIFFVKKLV